MSNPMEELTRQFEAETDTPPEEILHCAIANFETVGRFTGASSDPIFQLAMAQLKGTTVRLEKMP